MKTLLVTLLGLVAASVTHADVSINYSDVLGGSLNLPRMRMTGEPALALVQVISQAGRPVVMNGNRVLYRGIVLCTGRQLGSGFSYTCETNIVDSSNQTYKVPVNNKLGVTIAAYLVRAGSANHQYGSVYYMGKFACEGNRSIDTTNAYSCLFAAQ